MKKKYSPTPSQYSYMVTGLLAAQIHRYGELTNVGVTTAVKTAKMAFELISEAIGEIDDEEETEHKPSKEKETIPNYFQNYGWEGGRATWSELNAWLKKQGVTSNRRISNIFRESIEKGYIRKDENTRQYLPPLP